MSEIELQDAILRHALELQRLSAHEEAEALRIMAELEAELRMLLASQDLTEAGKREVEALIRDAHRVVDARYTTIAGQLDTRALVLIVAEKTVDVLDQAFPRATMPSAETLASLSRDVLIDGAPASAWWARQSEDTAFRFAREVRAGVLDGATNEQIVARIVGRGDEPGILGVARRNVRSLVHSSVMTAANRARLETYRKNGRHVAGVRVLETLDSHTCMTCMAYDGTSWDWDGNPLDQFTKDSGLEFALPLYHFGCRGTISAVPKSLNALLGVTGIDEKIAATATRASKDGPTKARNFAEFLKRQSPEFVEQTLGARRAELYLSGKLTLTDLVSGSGRPLTLTELQAL